MKRILFCASRASHIINFHIPYIKYFHDKGYEVDAAVQGTIQSELLTNCYDLKFTKNPLSPDNIITVHKLRKIMLERSYDIICSNTTLAGTAAKLAVKGVRPKPYFVHISHGYMFGKDGSIKSEIYRLCEKLTSSSADSLAVMNCEDFELAQKNHFGKTLHYIYGMGLDKNKFPPISENERENIRKKLGSDDKTKILLCAGEFSSRKNQSDIITGFSKLLDVHKNTTLVFAGEGDTLKNCKELAVSLGIDENIKFLGHCGDMNSLYRSADILLTASKMEGLPFNVMEALYCGLPVIASKIKGHTDLLEKGGGIMFEKENADDLAETLDQVLSNDELYLELRRGAVLDDRYLLENVMPKLISVLENTEVQK